MAVLEGKAYWASVTTPNTTYEPVYTVDLVVDDSVADSFEARGFRVKTLSIMMDKVFTLKPLASKLSATLSSTTKSTVYTGS